MKEELDLSTDTDIANVYDRDGDSMIKPAR